jgi:ketosteroid isomerase-like protein
MDASQVVNAYLTAFWSGDVDRARSLVADGFSFRGPLAQADDSAAFFASAAPLQPIVRGHELVRQWVDGNEVCSIYRCRLETARGAGSVLLTEWDTVRDDRVAAAQLAFDTAAFRALLPAATRESAAVALARAHLEAWTTHDLEAARANLAEDVEFFSPAGHLVGINQYMDAPRGLSQFARQVVPGSLRVIAAMGDERNALIMYEVSTGGGPLGSKVFPSAQTWLLDEHGKIKVERIVSYAAPRPA